MLAYFGGRTYRQVATELSIPEGTAKSRLRLALDEARRPPPPRPHRSGRAGMDLTTSELVEIGIDAATTERTDPASETSRRRILGAARPKGRPPMHPGWAGGAGDLTTHAAFITTAAELYAAARRRSRDDDWTRPTDVAGRVSVRDLVLHLVGVERYMLGQLGRREPLDAPTPADHFPVLRSAAADLESAETAHIARGWWLAALDLIGATARARTRPPHRLPRPSRQRAGDARHPHVRAVDPRRRHPPRRRPARRTCSTAPGSALMSSTLLGVLPYGMARAGTTQPGRTVRIDLTGPGRRHVVRRRLVARRPAGAARPRDRDRARSTSAGSHPTACRSTTSTVTVEGDRSLLEPVLVGRRRLRDGLKPATAGRTGTSRRTRGASRATREARCGSRSERRPGHRSIRRGHRRAGR